MAKTYSVGKIKQLIDLNGDSTNFEITFRVKSRNKEPFEILVVDQTTLDNNPSLEYKKADGEISGTIVNDKNVYQNYFLILRAETPCECDVEIIKKDLPKTSLPPPSVDSSPSRSRSPKNSIKDGFNWTQLLLISAAVAIIGVGFYFYSKRKEEETMYLESRSDEVADAVPVRTPVQVPVRTPVQPPTPSRSVSHASSALSETRQGYLNRLNNLKV